MVRAVLSLFLLVTKRLYGKEREWSIGQIKTCRKKQHVKIDDIKEMSDLICGKAAVGGNYNSTRDIQSDYNVTYGEAFEKYFDEEEWIYFDYEGRDIVEFDGIKESEKYVVQFELFYDEGYFNLYTIEIDNEPQNELVQAIIMTAIFTNSDTTESINDVVETTVVEEVEEGNISIGNFLGTWQDSYSQRCSMNITELDDGTYVSIDWANSASDGYLWTYYVENVDNGALWCTQGIKEYYSSTEGGELEYGTEYVDGTATLWIDSEGILHWEDNVLNEGAECLFEKCVY